MILASVVPFSLPGHYVRATVQGTIWHKIAYGYLFVLYDSLLFQLLNEDSLSINFKF